MMEQKQNATKSRDAQETVRNSNIGKALGDINKTDNVSVETPKISDASFIRKLSRPRSQRYIELLKREMEVSGRLSELYKQLEQKGISRYELAKRLEVSYPTIENIYKGTSTSIKLSILESLCKELNLHNKLIFKN